MKKPLKILESSGLEIKAIPLKTKPTLNRIKDGKKIAMKKKINIGYPISSQIYVFYLKSNLIFV
jgi:hypothetical protein